MANVLITINGDDQSTQAFQDARDNAKGLVGTMATLGPAMAPIAGAATAAVAGLASTLGGAAVSASAFKLAVQPQMAAVQEAAEAQSKYNDAVEQYGADSAQALKAQEAMKQQMAGMPAATQATAKEFVGLKSDFESWSNSLAGDTMPIFTKGIQILRDLLPTLTPIVEHASQVFGDLMSKLQRKVESKGFDAFAKKFQNWANKGLDNVVNGVTKLSRAVSGFVMGPGFQTFLESGEGAGANLGEIFQKLALFVGKFIEAAGPLAGLSFIALEALADALNAIPDSVLEVLAPTIMAIVVAMKAWQLAVVAYTAVQWLMNAAMTANPIGLLVLAIVGLVAAIVVLWKKNEGFRNFIIGAWEAIKKGVMAAFEFLKNIFMNWTGWGLLIKHWDTIKAKVISTWDTIKRWIGNALTFLKDLFLNWTGPGLIIKHWDRIKEKTGQLIRYIKDRWNAVVGFVKGIPGRISGTLSNMWNGLGSGFRSVVNGIIGRWNNLSFSIGGGSFMGFDVPTMRLDTPDIPYLARGGIASGLAMVGERGRELVNLPSGSHVRSAADTERMMGHSGVGDGRPLMITLKIGEKTLGELLVDPLRGAVRSRGGDVQAVLGRG